MPRGKTSRLSRGTRSRPYPPVSSSPVGPATDPVPSSSAVEATPMVSLPVSVSDLSMSQFVALISQVVRSNLPNSSAPPPSSSSTRASVAPVVSAGSSSAGSIISPSYLGPISSPSIFASSAHSGDLALGTLPPALSIASVGQLGQLMPSLYTGANLTPASPPSLDPLNSLGLQSQTQPGMSLSMSLRPIPARLVSLIQTGRYIEMRDLLGDNAAMGRHLDDIRASAGASVLQVSTRPRVREVSSLPSWICCFLTYLAVGTSDSLTRERLAYAILIIREFLRHGGSGWLEYDRLFRQQAAMDPSLRWNIIQPGLQATTIMAQRASSGGSFCSICQDCDHTATQCALAQFQQQSTTSRLNHQSGRSAPARYTSTRICHSWNDGACIHPGTCNYRHICLNCYQPTHPAKDCRAPPRSRAGPMPQKSSAGSTTH